MQRPIRKEMAALELCLIFIWSMGAPGNGKQIVANKFERPGNEVADSFINIDCGAKAGYVDDTTGFRYQTDEGFIGSGKNREVSPDAEFNDPSFGQQLGTVRSFPEGERNCYTLKPKQQKNYNYLIRAIFGYGNYDNKNQPPAFHLYLGVNFWAKVQLENSESDYTYYDIIQVPTDIVHVCLVNTGEGTPFISTLELRLSNNSIYSSSLPLNVETRGNLGSGLSSSLIRYKDDVYDRVWRLYNYSFGYPIKSTAEIRGGDSAYKLPSDVLRTALQPLNHSNSLSVNWSYGATKQHFVFLHFAEIQKLPPGHKRIINVTFDEDIGPLSQSITLEYLKPVTLSSKTPTQGYASFTVRAAAESNAPPILNALEIYTFVPQQNSSTDPEDVDAIMKIKSTYGLSRINWQGDPCVPPSFAWDGLNCSSDNNSRIISLNLTSSKLTGQIAASFANLEKLQALDLSNNELTGKLPEFLADLPNLKFINLTGNKLIGSIPKALREKADLQLSVADNPDLCQKDSCREHKFVIPLMVSIAVFLIIVIVSLMIWKLRKKRLVVSTEYQKREVLKQKNRSFSYSQVFFITNNFEIAIGEGGFGKVYLGTLEDDTLVAVKLLSPSSRQGYKEFQSEAQLLMVVHDRNLVSLVGYCNEHDFKALIYEYMDNGDLRQQLSVKNTNVLRWHERLQIIVDAAKGLDYMHNGCGTPIIHRDLKPSNILLNKKMLAKIADFGLSRAFTNEIDSHLSTQPAGTPGYIDPEFQRSGNLNKKSDIYSFGMILLELITGLPPIIREPEKISFILDLVCPKIECGDIQGIVDPRFAGEFGVISAWKAIEIAMSCISAEATQRPDISYVLQELKECLDLEMDHARPKSSSTGQSSSLNLTVQLESVTTPFAR